MSSNGKRARRKKIIGMVAETFYAVAKIVVLVVVVMGVYRFSSVAYEYGERVFGETAVEEEPGTDIEIEVLETDSVSDVAEKLEEAGLIRDAWLFTLQEALLGYEDGIVPGTYTLNTSETPEEMIEIISSDSDSDE